MLKCSVSHCFCLLSVFIFCGSNNSGIKVQIDNKIEMESTTELILSLIISNQSPQNCLEECELSYIPHRELLIRILLALPSLNDFIFESVLFKNY